MGILIAIIGLALLIVVHEGGHFLVARLCGMRVERFSIGFGKPLVSFKRGDTIYQIAPIPLGGFVQITGLNPHEDFDQNDPYVYPNRPRWMRLAVLVAGPGANYLIAVIMALGILMAYGKPIKATNQIDEVVPNSAAAGAGLMKGDEMVEADGKQLSDKLPITAMVQASKGAPMALKVKRGNEIRSPAGSPPTAATSSACTWCPSTCPSRPRRR
jgi:regulator of sigma E protease